MKKGVESVWWVAVGFWIAMLIVVAVEAKREEGGSMPLAAPFGVALLIGGLLFFLLSHVLIRKIWKDEPK